MEKGTRHRQLWLWLQTRASWDFGDGGTSSDQNPIHTYSETGVFDVKLRVANAVDADSTEQTVVIGEIETNGIRTLSSEIDLYPNPFKQFFHVNNLNTILSYEITNNLGQVMKSGRVGMNDEIELFGPAGIYFLILKSDPPRVIKIMKE